MPGTRRAQAALTALCDINKARKARRLAQTSVLENANYAQKTFSQVFGDEGKFTGRTVADIADALRTGKMSPADVPIDHIIRDGNTLILNTRSSQALTQAGIPRSKWNAVNRTGEKLFEDNLTGQLKNNKLTSEGTPTVSPSRGKN